MRNPFQQHGPVQVPVVEGSHGNGHDDGHTMDVFNIEEDGPKIAGKEFSETQSVGSSDKFTRDAQNGVLAMEAVTIIWTQKHLVIAYIL